MDKKVLVMLGLIIVILIGLSIFGGINFSEIKEKVTTVKNSVTSAQDSIKETIKNINKIKDAVAEAKTTIDQTNLDLIQMNKKLRLEFNKIKSSVNELEEKRKLLDSTIAKIKEQIPGEPKELKEPQYKKLGATR